MYLAYKTEIMKKKMNFTIDPLIYIYIYTTTNTILFLTS